MHATSPPRLAPLPDRMDRVEQVYRTLLEAIVSGQLEQDERYTQDALAERLGVSRQPVLQALLLLRRQGLVKDESGRRGVEVVPITPAFIQHLYAVRGALDGTAAACAAYRPRPELRDPGLARIRAGRAAAQADDPRALAEADHAFHALLYEAAHNPVLEKAAHEHWLHTRRVLATHLRSPTAARAVWTEHAALLNAVVRGDARLAQRLAQSHCDAAATALLRRAFQAERAAETRPAASAQSRGRATADGGSALSGAALRPRSSPGRARG
jgi:DNA-binding GntR family transcriptional regulator